MSIVSLRSLFATLALSLALPGCAGEVVVAPIEEGVAEAQAHLLSLSEGFEAGTKTSYAAADVKLATGVWNLNDALLGGLDGDAKTGAKSTRLVRNGTLRMQFDAPNGAETVRVSHATYGADASSSWELWYSTTGGASWAQAGTTVKTAAPTLTTTAFTLHVDGPVRLEIRKVSGSGARLNIDDVLIDEFVPSPFTLASWNIRDLSVASRDANEQAQIADVLEAYDVVAVQEVNDTKILGELTTVLDGRGGSWSHVQCAKVGNTTGTAEHYGVAYRDDVATVLDVQTLPEVVTETGARFDRDPCAIRMATVDGRFDWTIINVHVTWGSLVRHRVAEVKALRDYHALVSDMEADVIITGDFNRNADDASVGWLAAATGLVSTTDPSVPTHISSDTTYDQIMLSPTLTAEYAGEHGVDAFDDRLFKGNDDAASLAISDHRPVWVRLHPTHDDD